MDLLFKLLNFPNLADKTFNLKQNKIFYDNNQFFQIFYLVLDIKGQLQEQQESLYIELIQQLFSLENDRFSDQ